MNRLPPFPLRSDKGESGSPIGPSAAASSGDFLRLLRDSGYSLGAEQVAGAAATKAALDTQGTTVIAMKYQGGVLNLADRRATSENVVMYDRAEKIIALDDHTLIAISGSYARAMEVVRYLQHSFQYYKRTQLQEMSLEGKLAEVSRMIAENVASALQGIGGFLPVLSAWDARAGDGRIFFYDGLGARFEYGEFGAQGSGSHRIRGVFDYVIATKGPFHQMPLEQALGEALVLLQIAAELDAFTGGYEKSMPLAITVSADGITTLSDDDVLHTVEKVRRSHDGH